MASQFSRTTGALHGETSRYAFVVWLSALALLACWLAWFFSGTVTIYEISRKARVEVAQAAHPASALIASRITATPVAIGQEVKAGDVLIELDAAAERLRLHEEEARLAAIPPRIESLRKEIALREQSRAQDQQSAQAATEAARFRSKEAGAAAEFAKDHARRLADEARVGGVAQIEALRALSEAQKLTASGDALNSEVRRLEAETQTRTHQAQAQIQGLNGAVALLEGEMATIRATIDRLKLDIEKHLVRAPVDGRIGDVVPLKVGSYVSEGQKLVTVVPHGDLMIVADFAPAAVLGRISRGQSARLRLDGFPWAQFGSIEAKVNRVASEIRDGQVRVEFTVAPSPDLRVLMQHGLPGAIEVRVDRISPAVLVLRSAGQLLAAPPAQAEPRS